VLFLLHIFLTFFESVALALDIDDGAVVQDAVEDRGGDGDGDVGKDFVPLREGLVGGKDSGCPLITPCNQLKKQMAP
jgi:hypothetical protein